VSPYRGLRDERLGTVKRLRRRALEKLKIWISHLFQ